jgi:hypothetical protein
MAVHITSGGCIQKLGGISLLPHIHIAPRLPQWQAHALYLASWETTFQMNFDDMFSGGKGAEDVGPLGCKV